MGAGRGEDVSAREVQRSLERARLPTTCEPGTLPPPQKKDSTSNIPTSLDKDTLGLGTPGILWGWALRGHSGVHSRFGTAGRLELGTPGTLSETLLAGTLQEDCGVGHSGRLWGWESGNIPGDSGLALWGHSGVGRSRESLGGHSKDTLGLGTPMNEE